jgi:hypothetical protein
MPGGESEAGGCRRSGLHTGSFGGWPGHLAAVVTIGVVAAIAWQASAQVALPESRPRAQKVQSGSPPSIAVRSLVVAEPASQMPFEVKVAPSEAIPRNSFLRLRGLPPTASLSEGHSIAPGSWAVPLNGLPRLTLILPATAAGKSELIVTLVGEDGTLLAEAHVSLVILPASQVVPADKGAKAAEPPRPQVPGLTPQDRENAEKLVARGKRDLQQGNVAQARQFFLRAAQAGLAEGALMLAATYDPRELARMGAVGIQANLAEARRWYARAAELGSPEAAEKLATLGGS